MNQTPYERELQACDPTSIRLSVLVARYGKVLQHPRWISSGRKHDWRDFVPRSVKEEWDQLNDLGRAAAYVLARKMANLEEVE